jgi:hypothetical protein
MWAFKKNKNKNKISSLLDIINTIIIKKFPFSPTSRQAGRQRRSTVFC